MIAVGSDVDNQIEAFTLFEKKMLILCFERLKTYIKVTHEWESISPQNIQFPFPMYPLKKKKTDSCYAAVQSIPNRNVCFSDSHVSVYVMTSVIKLFRGGRK